MTSFIEKLILVMFILVQQSSAEEVRDVFFQFRVFLLAKQ